MGQGYGTRFDLIMPIEGFSLLSLVLITLARRTYMLQKWLATVYASPRSGAGWSGEWELVSQQEQDGKLHSLPTRPAGTLAHVVQSRTR